LLVVANVSTKLSDAILFVVLLESHDNKTPWSITNVKVKVVLFSEVTMVFSLQAQWWDVILVVFNAVIFFLMLPKVLMYAYGNVLNT
jgi:hypothetical protein